MHCVVTLSEAQIEAVEVYSVSIYKGKDKMSSPEVQELTLANLISILARRTVKVPEK